ncbi:MAG: GNAT family N-acetyltransferase [Eubacterium sp.]
MIEFTENREQIISLWCTVFAEDSREDAAFFLDNKKNISCLGYFENNRLVSMLFLADCVYGALKGKYVYAVCTYKAHRGRGYSSALLKEAKKFMQDFLWLIPANDSLFDFYKKAGFETKLFSNGDFENKICFDETDNIIEYLYSGSAYAFPKGMVYCEKDFPVGSTGLERKRG